MSCLKVQWRQLITDLFVPPRAGAVAVGAAHYAGSTKALAEEGIDPRMRLRAIPMAVSFNRPSFPSCCTRACDKPSCPSCRTHARDKLRRARAY